jgi:hypothetical protein
MLRDRNNILIGYWVVLLVWYWRSETEPCNIQIRANCRYDSPLLLYMYICSIFYCTVNGYNLDIWLNWQLLFEFRLSIHSHFEFRLAVNWLMMELPGIVDFMGK